VPTWSLIRPNILEYKSWDDGAVVFNQQTGETHHVSLLAIELINCLQISPSETISGFLERLKDIFSDDDSTQDATEIIQNALIQLESISLVKRIPD
jgi:PqqD family protein of HPr-rel-A system